MNMTIVNGSVTIGGKVINLVEEDIAKHWRPWKNILDEDSNDVVIRDTYDDKQIALAKMRKNKEKVLPKIYHTTFDEYSHLVNSMTGKAYHYNNRECRMEIRENKIYLIKWESGNEKVVFDGYNFITTSGDWLMANSQTLSRKGYKGVLYSKNELRMGKLPLKNHQIVAALFFGQHAIDTAIDGENDINHRNLNEYDDRPENLEIITKLENKWHARTMRSLLLDKVKEYLESLNEDEIV